MPGAGPEDEYMLRPGYPEDAPGQPPAEGGGWSPVSQEQDGEWPAYPDQVYASSSWARGGAPRREKRTALWAFVALLCGAALCLLGFAVSSLYQAYIPFRQRVAQVSGDTFAPGLTVDGVSIGGMTRAQAEAALGAPDGWSESALRLTVQVDDKTWLITGRELPLQRNLTQLLDAAFAVGRQGSRETIFSSMTPFEYRWAHRSHVAAQPVALSTQVTYDPQAVRQIVSAIADQAEKAPVDAQVATFDFSSRSFTYTQDQPGAYLDREALYQRLIGALDRRDYSASIRLSTEAVLPRVTRVELMNAFSLVSSFTTQTTGDASRNNNISLAAAAVSGTVVMPGETFSFNAATGERTLEKGYLPAAAIAGGTTVDEVGGGVCQVSSTLFNAAAMADLTILSRSPHAWPSNYVDKGRDATVNWPNLDFSFRNDKSAPVFIVAYYQNRRCTVEIYGPTLGAGVNVELETRLISTTPPPTEPDRVFNPEVPFGTEREKIKARTGYVVETYKVYRKNGAETRRELLCVSTYPMLRQVLEYNY